MSASGTLATAASAFRWRQLRLFAGMPAGRSGWIPAGPNEQRRLQSHTSKGRPGTESFRRKQHQGAVFGFREVTSLDSPWRLARPVRYVEELPKLLDDNFLADLAFGPSFDTATLMNRLI
jgi:hypothetical protein